mgnify:CR=1 FL=1
MIVVRVEQNWVNPRVSRTLNIVDIRIANISNSIIANPIAIHQR